MVAREISRLDREERQILIKTYVVEIDAGNGVGGGIDWSTALGTAAGQGTTFSLQSPGPPASTPAVIAAAVAAAAVATAAVPMVSAR